MQGLSNKIKNLELLKEIRSARENDTNQYLKNTSSTPQIVQQLYKQTHRDNHDNIRR